MKTSTNTATGVTWPATARAGGRAPSLSDGLLIASVTGHLLVRGAGPGSKMSPGDSLPSTTDAGRLWAQGGSGFPDRSWFAPYGRRLWWHSWAAVRVSGFPPALALGGSHSPREKSICPDIA